jgi:hypothetical protein
MYNPLSMFQPAGKLVVHHRSQGAAIASLDGFFLMRCFGDLTAADVRATLMAHDAIIGVRPAGSGSIVAVDPTTSFPSEEMRRAALEVTRQTNAQTRCHVLIVLGDGFWASAVRGIMMTISSLTAATHPRRVVRYEEEGVDWVIGTLGESPSKYRQLLLTSLAELRPGATVPPIAPKVES